MKRHFTMVILLIFIFTICLSCAKTPEKADNQTGDIVQSHSDTESEAAIPDIPDQKYDGYLFNIASTSENTTFDIWRFDYEEQTGEVVEDAFFTRNMNIEERHDIKFAAHTVSLAQITKTINANDEAYDIVFERASLLPSTISGGYMLDLESIPYLDLSWGFWDQNSINDLSVFNKIFMAAGDIHLSSFDCTWTLYFDKMLVDEYNLDNPYDLIDKNEWTIDKFTDLCKLVSSDLDGNSKMDVNDFWGFSTHQGTYPGLMIAMGEKFISKDAEGVPQLSMNTDKFYQAYLKALKLMHEDDATYEQIAKMGSFSQNQQCDIFIEDRAVFFSEVMNIITTMLRNKGNDYGVIPWPKYDTAQERYNNYVNESAAMLVIPKTASDTERTGIIVQDLAYESSKTVREAYYEIAIVDKYSRDEKMSEMMDIIFANRTYELAFVYGWGGFSGAFYTLCVKNTVDLASFIAKHEEKVVKNIETFGTNIEKNLLEG